MWIPLLLSVVLAAPIATPTGTIQGTIAPPEKVKITKPVQVVVFSGEYVNVYLAEVQNRLDTYWREFIGVFTQDKESFLIFRERAQLQALESAVNRMKRDDPRNASQFIQTATNNSFKFQNVPQGECKVVALVTIGNQEFVWSESVILKSDTSALVILKPTVP